MKEKRFKFFLQSEINRTVRDVESIVLKQVVEPSIFINIDKLRYLNLNSLKELILKNSVKKKTSIAAFYPINLKSIFRLIRQSIFYRNEFCSSADIIQIRNNLSLFYFKEGIRVKIYMKAGVRSLEAFKNECYVRKQVENTGLLYIPRILAENFDHEPVFFVDEIVFGKTINWDDPGGTQILEQVLRDIWRFYQTNGILWSTPLEKGVDIPRLVTEFQFRFNKKLIAKPDLPLDEILSFSEKYIPSSLIHGDFSLGNIIRTSSENYLIDWELARHDFIIKDLYKTLLNKWELFDFIDNLMGSEIKQHFRNDSDCALSLYEQFLLEHFLHEFNKN